MSASMDITDIPSPLQRGWDVNSISDDGTIVVGQTTSISHGMWEAPHPSFSLQGIVIHDGSNTIAITGAAGYAAAAHDVLFA